MGAFTIDFSDIEDSPETLEPGKYLVTVESVIMKDSLSSDNPYLLWVLKVIEGNYMGHSLIFVTSTSNASIWRLKQTLSALGIDSSEVVNFEIDEESKYVIRPRLVGLTAIADVGLDEYKGQIKNKVKSLESSNSEPKKKNPAAAPSKRSFV